MFTLHDGSLTVNGTFLTEAHVVARISPQKVAKASPPSYYNLCIRALLQTMPFSRSLTLAALCNWKPRPLFSKQETCPSFRTTRSSSPRTSKRVVERPHSQQSGPSAVLATRVCGLFTMPAPVPISARSRGILMPAAPPPSPSPPLAREQCPSHESARVLPTRFQGAGRACCSREGDCVWTQDGEPGRRAPGLIGCAGGRETGTARCTPFIAGSCATASAETGGPGPSEARHARPRGRRRAQGRRGALSGHTTCRTGLRGRRARGGGIPDSAIERRADVYVPRPRREVRVSSRV